MKLALMQLVIMTVSAITTAMVPSKPKGPSSFCLPDGIEIDSSLGGSALGSTVTAQVGGGRSWTATGKPCVADDFLSATSLDEFDCTNTNQVWIDCEAHSATADYTTQTADEL